MKDEMKLREKLNVINQEGAFICQLYFEGKITKAEYDKKMDEINEDLISIINTKE